MYSSAKTRDLQSFPTRRSSDLERVKEAQARELMRWEAEQHVPFDMESVELDFQILDPDGDGLERSEEHTSELQSHLNLVCRLLLEKKNSSHRRASGRNEGTAKS